MTSSSPPGDPQSRSSNISPSIAMTTRNMPDFAACSCPPNRLGPVVLLRECPTGALPRTGHGGCRIQTPRRPLEQDVAREQRATRSAILRALARWCVDRDRVTSALLSSSRISLITSVMIDPRPVSARRTEDSGSARSLRETDPRRYSRKSADACSRFRTRLTISDLPPRLTFSSCVDRGAGKRRCRYFHGVEEGAFRNASRNACSSVQVALESDRCPPSTYTLPASVG